MNHLDDYSRNYASLEQKKCKKNGKMEIENK